MMSNELNGKFTADGNNKILKIGAEVQWLVLRNSTQAAATNNGYGYEFHWSDEMGSGSFMEYHPAADNTKASTFITAGIDQMTTYNKAIGGAVVVASGTNATQPVYQTGDTSGVSDGSIVRILGSAQKNLHGMDFSVSDLTLNTEFKMAYALATAPGVVSGACTYKLVAANREVYDFIFPKKRTITNISQAASAVVTVSVEHGYSVGALVRINVPSYCGMLEMHGLVGTVTAVSAGTFTLDINSTAFTAFKFPVAATAEFIRAEAIPIGDTTTLGFEGSKDNDSFRGFVLAAGTTSPAGNVGDIIYWRAGTSAKVTG